MTSEIKPCQYECGKYNPGDPAQTDCRVVRSECGTYLRARVAELEAERAADIGHEMARYLAAEWGRIVGREPDDCLDEARSAIRAALASAPDSEGGADGDEGEG